MKLPVLPKSLVDDLRPHFQDAESFFGGGIRNNDGLDEGQKVFIGVFVVFEEGGELRIEESVEFLLIFLVFLKNTSFVVNVVVVGFPHIPFGFEENTWFVVVFPSKDFIFFLQLGSIC